MSNTKSTTISPTAPISTTDYIAERDAEAVAAYHGAKAALVAAQERAEEAKAALVAAQERAEEAELAVDYAELALDDLEADATMLDTTVTAAQHAEAVSAFRLSELAVKGARARLRTAENSITVPDSVAAQVVALAMRAFMPSVTVIASIRDLGAHIPSADELPLCVVITDGPSVLSKTGAISGDVKVKWFKGPHHVGMDAKKIKDAGESVGVYVETKGSVTGRKDGSVEELRLRLNEGILDVPYITNVSTGPKNFASTIVTALGMETAYHGEACRISRLNAGLANSLISVLAGETSIASEEISEEGSRLLTVDISVMVEQHAQMNGRGVTEALTTVIGDLNNNTWLPGLGRIDRIDVISADQTTAEVLDDRHVRTVMRGTAGNDLPINSAEVGYESIAVFHLRVVARSTTLAPGITAA